MSSISDARTDSYMLAAAAPVAGGDDVYPPPEYSGGQAGELVSSQPSAEVLPQNGDAKADKRQLMANTLDIGGPAPPPYSGPTPAQQQAQFPAAPLYPPPISRGSEPLPGFPPGYNAVIEVDGSNLYPPPPKRTLYPPESPIAYKHDFRAAGGARVPQILLSSPGGESIPFACQRLSVHIDANFSAAFVTMSMAFAAPAGLDKAAYGSAVFLLPQKHTSTVSSCTYAVGPEQRRYDVSVLKNSDAAELAQKHAPSAEQQRADIPHNPDANCFVLPVPGVASGDVVTVDVTFFDAVESFGGQYELLIPLDFDKAHMPPSEINQRCSITCSVNAGQRNFEASGPHFPATESYRLSAWSTTHQLWAGQESPWRLSGRVVSGRPWQNKDFVLCYTTITSSIMGAVVVGGAPPNSYDPRNTFALFLSPPSTPASHAVHRNVVFLLDKSYSMQGAPYTDAKRALEAGLGMLRPYDHFTIITFSHFTSPMWNEKTVHPASAANIERARTWLRSTEPDGGTDILLAMTEANTALGQARSAGKAPQQNIDCVFLLSDGSVGNEREICRYVEKSMPATRIFTFGIGGYVNTSFLRMLGRTGRGFTDISLNQDCVYDQMIHLMNKAAAPILVDITIKVPGEVYPRKVPDLYQVGSLVVAGRFDGMLPPVTVTGTVPGYAQPYTMVITPEINTYMPLDRLFVKTMMDDLTAEAWLNESAKIQERVETISVNENMPSAYTQMVAHPKVDEDPKNKNNPKRGQKGYNARTAAAVIGGAALAGAGIFILAQSGALGGFGDAAATLANNPVADLLGADGIFDALGAVGEGIGDAVGAIGDAGEGLCDCCGNLAEDGCEGCDGCFNGIGDAAGGCCDGVGDVAGDCCDGVGQCCESIDVADVICNCLCAVLD